MLMSGVGYAGMAYGVSRFLTKPRRRAVAAAPSASDLSSAPFNLQTEDGISISGWVVEPAHAHATIAMFHGMRQTREQMRSRIEFLAREGFRCVAIDHRAHGESGGNRVSFGWYESRDVLAVERWIEERYPGQRRYALGISMGAAALCFAGRACQWDGVVVEGVYADVGAAFRRRIGKFYPAWFRQVTPAVLWITQKRLRVRSAQQLRPVEAVKSWRGVRLLGITGECDTFAPVSDGLEVVGAVPGGTDFLVVPNAGHSDVFESGGEIYRAKLLSFLGA
jgi:pimeloyl-ACP methyl ester carboxylesterase